MFLVAYWQKESVRVQCDIVTCLRWTATTTTQNRKRKNPKNMITHAHIVNGNVWGTRKRKVAAHKRKSHRMHAKQFVLFACIEMLPLFCLLLLSVAHLFHELCSTKQIGCNQRKSKWMLPSNNNHRCSVAANRPHLLITISVSTSQNNL